MTETECKYLLEKNNKKYEADKKKLEDAHATSIQNILNSWAHSNRNFNVGDIIERNGVIILVESIVGREFKGYLEIIYKGRRLTQHLKMRKSERSYHFVDEENCGLKINLIRRTSKPI